MKLVDHPATARQKAGQYALALFAVHVSSALHEPFPLTALAASVLRAGVAWLVFASIAAFAFPTTVQGAALQTAFRTEEPPSCAVASTVPPGVLPHLVQPAVPERAVVDRAPVGTFATAYISVTGPVQSAVLACDGDQGQCRVDDLLNVTVRQGNQLHRCSVLFASADRTRVLDQPPVDLAPMLTSGQNEITLDFIDLVPPKHSTTAVFLYVVPTARASPSPTIPPATATARPRLATTTPAPTYTAVPPGVPPPRATSLAAGPGTVSTRAAAARMAANAPWLLVGGLALLILLLLTCARRRRAGPMVEAADPGRMCGLISCEAPGLRPLWLLPLGHYPTGVTVAVKESQLRPLKGLVAGGLLHVAPGAHGPEIRTDAGPALRLSEHPRGEFSNGVRYVWRDPLGYTRRPPARPRRRVSVRVRF